MSVSFRFEIFGSQERHLYWFSEETSIKPVVRAYRKSEVVRGPAPKIPYAPQPAYITYYDDGDDKTTRIIDHELDELKKRQKREVELESVVEYREVSRCKIYILRTNKNDETEWDEPIKIYTIINIKRKAHHYFQR
ncbi:CLUMA_CG019289, isoform A [Clunio marinus]|uniref:CLUMA_CG019289, isoform A n=1 Tax=Clunio marinus TaxID=568069 RepID=A0A1J1J0R4_9DIPT|nr:CLUMA_CG019289, isoform A [Clunio marinus]